jgi:O-antigen/teichoic acid export membrane protein
LSSTPQRQSRRRAALSTLAGTGTTVAITVAQAFILIPLCLTHLGTTLYGAWLGGSELLVWLQLLDLGIPNLMTQRIGSAVGQSDTDSAARWSATGLGVVTALALMLALLAIAAAPFVTVWAGVPEAEAEAFTACFRMGAVASAALMAYNGVLGIARGVQITGVVNVTQVTAALTGFAAAVVLLVAGFGIWSLALGLLARAAVSLCGSVLFLFQLRRVSGSWPGRFSASVMREVAQLAPPMAAANAGYLLANNSEVVIVTTIFGPIGAAVYALTRRAIDGFRNLVDAIAWAVYGGFAHLVTADDRHRARNVLDEILWLRLGAACLCGAVVLAVNQPFVTLLFGRENFGGMWLTAGFVVQLIVGGQSFLSNYLLRAAGHVAEGSILLTIEAVLRVVAVSAAFLLIGLSAAPWAATAISAAALLFTLRWLERELPPATKARLGVLSRVSPLIVIAFGLFAALVGVPLSWFWVTVSAAAVALSGAAVLWWLLPSAATEGSLLRWVRT